MKIQVMPLACSAAQRAMTFAEPYLCPVCVLTPSRGEENAGARPTVKGRLSLTLPLNPPTFARPHITHG